MATHRWTIPQRPDFSGGLSVLLDGGEITATFPPARRFEFALVNGSVTYRWKYRGSTSNREETAYRTDGVVRIEGSDERPIECVTFEALGPECEVLLFYRSNPARETADVNLGSKLLPK